MAANTYQSLGQVSGRHRLVPHGGDAHAASPSGSRLLLVLLVIGYQHVLLGGHGELGLEGARQHRVGVIELALVGRIFGLNRGRVLVAMIQVVEPAAIKILLNHLVFKQVVDQSLDLIVPTLEGLTFAVLHGNCLLRLEFGLLDQFIDFEERFFAVLALLATLVTLVTV